MSVEYHRPESNETQIDCSPRRIDHRMPVRTARGRHFQLLQHRLHRELAV